MTVLSTISRNHIQTIPAAMRALDAMDRQITAARTYEELRKLVDGANAIKLVNSDIDVVKQRAEDVILDAYARIGEEIAKVPKERGPGGTKGTKTAITPQGKSSGRAATGISGTSRARYQQLAAAKPQLKNIAKELRRRGKDATPTAVVRVLKQGGKKKSRRQREVAFGKNVVAMPGNKYGVVYADPPWRFEPYSRETGMDRAADNHYPTMMLEEIKQLDVPAAKSCVLFLWATVPMLPQALEVMVAWGFEYKSHLVWDKKKIGTGYWNRNRHELLLIGTRGEVPAPDEKTRGPSLIAVARDRHSAKPVAFRKLIEKMFPTVRKIELFAREQVKGWDVWGNEVREAAE